MKRAARKVQLGWPQPVLGALLALGALAVLASACSPAAPSVLRPSGLGARDVARFWWVLFALATSVFTVVTGLIAFSVLRRNRAPGAPHGEVTWGGPFILMAGVLVPAIVLSGTFGLTLHEMALLAAPGRRAALTIQVVGHVWWWEVRYPGGAVGANEIHIPTGQAVRVDLTTADVIHSFWVPQLQTKTDMIPGRSNRTWLEADTPGRYRGQCSQFCGLQHAHMAFYVVADPPAQFQAWLALQAAPAPAPTTALAAAGQQVFLSQTCVGCHTVRGTAASGTLGPDLSHLADRETIAAGVLANSSTNLATWISNPQGAKPGTVMPPTGLSGPDLQALVAYLQALR